MESEVNVQSGKQSTWYFAESFNADVDSQRSTLPKQANFWGLGRSNPSVALIERILKQLEVGLSKLVFRFPAHEGTLRLYDSTGTY